MLSGIPRAVCGDLESFEILEFRDLGPLNALACEAKAHRHIRFVIGCRPTERVIAHNEEKFLPNDCWTVASALLRPRPLTRLQVKAPGDASAACGEVERGRSWLGFLDRLGQRGGMSLGPRARGAGLMPVRGRGLSFQDKVPVTFEGWGQRRC